MEEKDGVGSKDAVNGIQDRFDGTIHAPLGVQSLVHLHQHHGIYRSNYGYLWPTMGYLPLDQVAVTYLSIFQLKPVGATTKKES